MTDPTPEALRLAKRIRWGDGSLASVDEYAGEIDAFANKRVESVLLEPSEAAVEAMARAIATVHFGNKQHNVWWTAEQRASCIAYSVERNWRNHLPHARAALRGVALSVLGRDR